MIPPGTRSDSWRRYVGATAQRLRSMMTAEEAWDQAEELAEEGWRRGFFGRSNFETHGMRAQIVALRKKLEMSDSQSAWEVGEQLAEILERCVL